MGSTSSRRASTRRRRAARVPNRVIPNRAIPNRAITSSVGARHRSLATWWTVVIATAALASIGAAGDGSDPFADQVIAYVPGAAPAPGYTDPHVALGPPERFTGEGVFPGVVSLFNAPWLPEEIVSIGGGGCLTVRFDEPVIDDPANPWGIDLLVYGNAFFVDGGSGIEALFAGGGTIEVSPDGSSWATIDGVAADALFPTQGYADAGPFDEVAGRVPTLATRPVHPGLSMEHFSGLSYEQALELYAGAAGGAGVDLEESGFETISFVRICNDEPDGTVEIDAVADVTPTLPGDVTGDGVVDVDDLVEIVVHWGPLGSSTAADLDGNGTVDVDDLLIVIINWTA